MERPTREQVDHVLESIDEFDARLCGDEQDRLMTYAVLLVREVRALREEVKAGEVIIELQRTTQLGQKCSRLEAEVLELRREITERELGSRRRPATDAACTFLQGVDNEMPK